MGTHRGGLFDAQFLGGVRLRFFDATLLTSRVLINGNGLHHFHACGHGPIFPHLRVGLSDVHFAIRDHSVCGEQVALGGEHRVQFLNRQRAVQRKLLLLCH